MERFIEQRSIVLHKLEFELKQTINKYLMDGSVDFINTVTGEVEASIRGFLLSENVGVKKVKYPADWWQAFKERWFPVWARLRWPVVYTIVEFNVKAVYTDFKPSLPPARYGKHRFHTLECTYDAIEGE